MALRSYAGAAKRTTLSGDITATSTNILVADATGYPTGVDGPFAVAFALGNAAEEKVLIASRSGNTLTVATGGRGYDGTSAADHRTGTSVDHVLTAIDVREANTFINHGGTLTASAATVTPLVVKGAASQSANLLEARDDAGTLVATTSAAGRVQFGTTASASMTQARVNVSADVAGAIGLVVRGAASQSANLSEWQDSAGTVKTYVNSIGRLVSNVSVSAVQGASIEQAMLEAQPVGAAVKGLVVRGAASQSANLIEAQDSAGTVLAWVRADGVLGHRSSNTSTTAGTLNRYLITYDENGSAYKIPLYGA